MNNPFEDLENEKPGPQELFPACKHHYPGFRLKNSIL